MKFRSRHIFYQKLALLAIVCLFGIAEQNLIAQDYERIDAVILLYPKTVETPEEISKFISRDFSTEEEKVRAIYSWMIANIAYYPEAYKMFDYSFKNYRERNQKEEKTRNKIINYTLQKGLAVCEGYAMTFERLLELQGISNYLVRGDTKTHFKDLGRPYDTNHMWNVVLIDEAPYLFDLTWGAGRYTDKFIKEPSYFYYKTDPELFLKSHYPDMFEDALVDNVLSPEAFANRPILILQELRFDQLKRPKEGILDSSAYFGDIPFLVEGVTVAKVSYRYNNDVAEIPFTLENNTLTFQVPIELGAENLLIFFDDKPALGYRIH